MNKLAQSVRKLFDVSLLLLAAAMMGGCATNPVTKRTELTLVSEKQEIKLGSQQYLQNQKSAGGRFILDPQLVAYVNEVGQKLVRASDRPNLPYGWLTSRRRAGRRC